MRRKIYDKLVQWKQERNGTTALLVLAALYDTAVVDLADLPLNNSATAVTVTAVAECKVL